MASRYAFPAVLTVFVLLVLSAPLGIPGQAQLPPAWALASVFFWSLFRPASMPALAVFVVGLLLDLLAQGPVGIFVLILLLAHGVAVKYRRVLARSGFLLVWVAFAALAACASALEWGSVCLLNWRVLPLWPALFEFGVAAGLYPFLAAILIRAHRGLAAPELAA